MNKDGVSPLSLISVLCTIRKVARKGHVLLGYVVLAQREGQVRLYDFGAVIQNRLAQVA